MYCTVKSVLALATVVAYANDGYLRDAYRWVMGTYGSLIAVDQDAWRLEGIRMCTSHRLDNGTNTHRDSHEPKLYSSRPGVVFFVT